jgi:23S rRNA (adenine2503-C2)-methyltransferase
VRKVVFMGMGEPAHNLDNVMEAIELLGTAGGIGHKNLVFSTVGDARVFERLPQGRVKPALALSLHTTNAALRATLLPRAPRIAPDELVALRRGLRARHRLPDPVPVDAARRHQRRRRRGRRHRAAARRQVRDDEPDPLQRVDGLPSAARRPSAPRAWPASSRGAACWPRCASRPAQDVDGGCGQLRARGVIVMAVDVLAGESSCRAAHLHGAGNTSSGSSGRRDSKTTSWAFARSAKPVQLSSLSAALRATAS